MVIIPCRPQRAGTPHLPRIHLRSLKQTTIFILLPHGLGLEYAHVGALGQNGNSSRGRIASCCRVVVRNLPHPVQDYP